VGTKASQRPFDQPETFGRVGPESFQASRAALPKLQELDLSYNDLFENLSNALQFVAFGDGGAADENLPKSKGLSFPLEVFFSELFLAAPALAVLDVSHCCPNQKKCPQALVNALVSAARRRVEAGLPPLTALRVRGLRAVAAHTSGQHVLDVDRDFLAHLQLAMPTCDVDVEGMNLKLY